MKEPVTPTAGVAGVSAYSVPRAPTPIDLRLDGNEGMVPSAELWKDLADRGPELLRLYPDKRPLEELLAHRLGLSTDQILVTAGADDALDRICRAFLDRERHLILPQPTFEMLTRYPAVLGAEVVSVPWPEGPYPLAAVLAKVSARTGAIALVTPNNPTGAVATADDLRHLAEAAPHAVLIVDHAYVEYGGEDLTRRALELPNAIVTRSLSKAFGLAGLRLGYAVAQPRLIDWLRAAGGPYPVSGPSIALACRQLSRPTGEFEAHVDRIHAERDQLFEFLLELGTRPLPSAANFITTRCDDPLWMRDAMAGLGIGVRAFPDRADLRQALRITCPGNERDFERLEAALRTVLRPEALLFDMDGVLADVSGSYRECIVRTAATYDVSLSAADVTAAKSEGDANNDWLLTQRLLERRGVSAPLDEVTGRFEEFYQGANGRPGLRDTERLLIDKATLERLAQRLPCAVVTGRPRADMRHFLEANGIADVLKVSVCMEDAPLKPDPTCVRLALEELGVRHAWMLGDTPDDIRAGRGAGVLPLGVAAPGDSLEAVSRALLAAGGARVLARPADIEERLP